MNMKIILLLTTIVLFKFSYSQFSIGLGYHSKMDDIFNQDQSDSYFKSAYYFNQFSINSSYQNKKLLIDLGVFYSYSNGVIKGVNIIENNSAFSSSSKTYYSSAKIHTDNLGFNLSISKMMGKRQNFKHFVGMTFIANSNLNIDESEHSKVLATKWHYSYSIFEDSGEEVYPATHEIFDAAESRPINLSIGVCYKPRLTINAFFIQFNFGLSYFLNQSFTNNIYNYYGPTDFSSGIFGRAIASIQYGSTIGYRFKLKSSTTNKDQVKPNK